MQGPESYLLGLVQEHTVGLRVARGEDNLAVLTAIWQAPGPLALKLTLHLTAPAAVTVSFTLSAEFPIICGRRIYMGGPHLSWIV